ncbi:methylated-DNA--[protein]-cysteine S-methyltransferase [Bacillus cytotoxicus]|uniref:Methylated-DNA--protein-cysteine methyltransferase n=1 Tax=Bacillus cytotoxicus (strain DSM 22905 / CIP 110041 / 391-98 / NVH 391-98) TaxID=315749 RepID=A7GNY5_BACCN|nr:MULTISPECIES: methylated-DNA--[protein]-cysteine S-methyltransferase [Bacillus cereus group]ABS21843.1 methylated-DNA--protein-cysteine methyltransferase [Bacillus cytotoxicus NVH 391-98]AWC28452.1 cysteine methyltransferase [Bacillus cytotoxicus]AWC32478.1 cysteine methyltransferase [Bacillus cytotoxicus]AWC36508.1 cysteine methyltransferase [Bacillus cytotoxicus]AWC40163.1 cysteine methyltransferase [Bacillus cytotoxicus]
MYRAYYKSEVGLLEVTANEKGITSILFVEEQGEENPNVVVEQCIAELDEYFNQKRTVFSVPLSAEGTAFQKKVWEALYTIPYGTSASYLDIAKKIGNQKAVRAIGGANSRNPISIIVPCHRIIGKSGKLVGYTGGLWRKEWLLKHEGILK